MTAPPLLDVKDLTVEFATRRGVVRAVQHVNISVAKGETLGIVGESGSGKSVTSYAVMRILDRAGKIAEGSVVFSRIDVKTASEDQMRDLRGREISMIFQNPRAALNPIRKVGDQIEDVLRQHVQQSTVTDRGEKAIEALEQVKIARPRVRRVPLIPTFSERVPLVSTPQAGRRERHRCFSSRNWSRNIRARARPPCSANCSAARRRSRRTCSAPSTASAFPSAMARASA